MFISDDRLDVFSDEDAIEILDNYVRVYEEDLRTKTLHGTVLGQFWEIALQEILEEYVIDQLDQDSVIGTGAISQDPPIKKGQCDVFILPKSGQGSDFFVGNLTVVPLNVASAVIEVKYPAKSRKKLRKALKQVNDIKNMSPQTKVYLFIVSAMTEATTLETTKAWLLDDSNRKSPDLLVLFNRSRVFVPFEDEQGHIDFYDEFQELENASAQFATVQADTGIPYNEIQEYTEELRQKGANLLFFLSKLVKDLNSGN